MSKFFSIFVFLIVFSVLTVGNSTFSSAKSNSGSIEGNISYFYNDYVGYKPDVNARIVLLSTKMNYKKYSYSKLRSFAMYDKKSSNNTDFYSGYANGKGDYKIKNVKAGKYLAIIRSKGFFPKVMKDPKQKDVNKVYKIYGSEAGEVLVANTMLMTKYHITTVTIKKNQAEDVSKNFGKYD